MLIGLWVISVLISIAPLLGWSSYVFRYGPAVCAFDIHSNPSFLIVLVVLVYIAPLATIVYAYSSIIRAVLRSRKAVATQTSVPTERDRFDIRMIQTSFAICIAFIVCWTPMSAIDVATVMGFEVDSYWYILSMFSIYSNTLIDPLLYALMYEPFQREFRKLLQ